MIINCPGEQRKITELRK